MPRRSSTGPTIRDIAAKADVSVGTVSRVLNRAGDVDTALRVRVETVARRLGYEIGPRTRRLMREKAGIVGLMLCGQNAITAAESELLLGAEACLSEEGFSLLFARHRDGSEMPRALDLPGLAGCVILIGAVEQKLVARLKQLGLEPVLLGNHLLDADSKLKPSVTFDDASGAAEATRYLAQLGHKSIWYIGDASRLWHQNRLRGYTEEMRACGLDPHIHTIALSDDEYENGRAAVSHILDEKWDMTAVLAGTDRIALGVVEGLRQHRRETPRDVSVIGFEYSADKQRASRMTSVSVDMMRVGRELAKAAISRIERSATDAPVIIPPHLIKRSTCRPMRKEDHMIL